MSNGKGIEINEDINGEVDDAWREAMNNRPQKSVEESDKEAIALKFVNIATGEEFSGELPDPATAIYSEKIGSLFITKSETAQSGDDNYEKVVTADMFARGYIREDKVK